MGSFQTKFVPDVEIIFKKTFIFPSQTSSWNLIKNINKISTYVLHVHVHGSHHGSYLTRSEKENLYGPKRVSSETFHCLVPLENKIHKEKSLKERQERYELTSS